MASLAGRPWRPAFTYFATVFAIGFVLGVLRTLFVQAGASRLLGVALELPLMLGASWMLCAWTMRRHAVPAVTGLRLQIGAIAFAWLMAAELLLSTLLAGRTLAEHVALYQEPSHLLGLAGQIAFGLMPAVLALRSPR